GAAERHQELLLSGLSMRPAGPEQRYQSRHEAKGSRRRAVDNRNLAPAESCGVGRQRPNEQGRRHQKSGSSLQVSYRCSFRESESSMRFAKATKWAMPPTNPTTAPPTTPHGAQPSQYSKRRPIPIGTTISKPTWAKET